MRMTFRIAILVVMFVGTRTDFITADECPVPPEQACMDAAEAERAQLAQMCSAASCAGSGSCYDWSYAAYDCEYDQNGCFVRVSELGAACYGWCYNWNWCEYYE